MGMGDELTALHPDLEVHGEGRIPLLNVDQGWKHQIARTDGPGSLPAFDTSKSEGENRSATRVRIR